MNIKKYVNIYDYLRNEDNFYSGAHDRIKQWKNKDNVMSFLQSYIEEIFMNYETGEIEAGETELNDFIWFDADEILKENGYSEDYLWD